MNKEIDSLINKPIKDDLSNWNITDIQLMKSYLVNLQHQLEEKDKVIDKAINYITNNLTIASILNGKKTYCLNSYNFDYEELLEILERGKK